MVILANGNLGRIDPSSPISPGGSTIPSLKAGVLEQRTFNSLFSNCTAGEYRRRALLTQHRSQVLLHQFLQATIMLPLL